MIARIHSVIILLVVFIVIVLQYTLRWYSGPISIILAFLSGQTYQLVTIETAVGSNRANFGTCYMYVSILWWTDFTTFDDPYIDIHHIVSM